MPLLAARVRTSHPARRMVRVLAGRKEKQAAAVEQKKATADQAEQAAVDAEGLPVPPAGAMMYPPSRYGADLNRDPRASSAAAGVRGVRGMHRHGLYTPLTVLAPHYTKPPLIAYTAPARVSSPIALHRPVGGMNGNETPVSRLSMYGQCWVGC